MILVNLIPYRDKQQEQRKQIFLASIFGVVLFSALCWYMVYGVFVHKTAHEQLKVNYLQGVVKQLDNKTAAVAQLFKKKNELISREAVITGLQDKRSLAVQIFNAFTSVTPAEMYLNKLTQNGSVIVLSGYAESNSVIAAFMRNIKSDKIFAKPTLIIISDAHVGGFNVKSFTLQVKLVNLHDTVNGKK